MTPTPKRSPTADPAYLVVGHVNKAHGTRGEVFVWPLTDHPGSVFAPGVVLRSGTTEGALATDLPPELTIASVRPYRRGYLVRFEGVETRTQAEALHGRYVLQSVDALPGRGEDELFYHELLGMRVETSGGEEVGEIVEVYELRPADMLEVRRPQGGTALIPFLDAYVVEIDVGARRMVLDPPEGLLDL